MGKSHKEVGCPENKENFSFSLVSLFIWYGVCIVCCLVVCTGTLWPSCIKQLKIQREFSANVPLL